MLRSELIEALVARGTVDSTAKAEAVVDTFLDEITAALARGDRVELRGFGAFSVRQREARIGRNPRTGEAVPVEPKAVPFFRAGKELREKLNKKAAPAKKAAAKKAPAKKA